jgi:hypothetical protein
VIRRIDAVLFALVIAASVTAFALELVYFNYGVLLSPRGLLHDTSNYQGALKSSWYFATRSRLDLSEWAQVGQRLTSEYMSPVFLPLALIGLWRVVRQFIRKPAEPQLTLAALMIGQFITLVIFFNVIVVHDYYALPYLPIYCALASIGLLYTYSFIRMPYASYPRAYMVLVVATIFGSVWYAYSLQLLNYNGNRAGIEIGKDLQDLVPGDGNVFYLQPADVTNPEHLYYARRRGVLANIDAADNAFVSQTIRDHRWNPDNTYLLANTIRLLPGQQDRLKARLDKFDLRELGTSFDRGIVYKLVPKE